MFERKIILFFSLFIPFLQLFAQQKTIEVQVTKLYSAVARDQHIPIIRDAEPDLSLKVKVPEHDLVFDSSIFNADSLLNERFEFDIGRFQKSSIELVVEIYENDYLLDRFKEKELVASAKVSLDYRAFLDNLSNYQEEAPLYNSQSRTFKGEVTIRFLDKNSEALNSVRRSCFDIDLLRDNGVNIPVSNQVVGGNDTSTCYAHSASDLIDYEKRIFGDSSDVPEENLAILERIQSQSRSAGCLRGGLCHTAIEGFNELDGFICSKRTPIEQEVTYDHLKALEYSHWEHISKLRQACKGIVDIERITSYLALNYPSRREPNWEELRRSRGLTEKQVSFLKSVGAGRDENWSDKLMRRDSLIKMGCRDLFQEKEFENEYRKLTGAETGSPHLLSNPRLTREDFYKIRLGQASSRRAYLKSVCPGSKFLGKVRPPKVKTYNSSFGPSRMFPSKIGEPSPSDFVDELLLRDNPSLISIGICSGALLGREDCNSNPCHYSCRTAL